VSTRNAPRLRQAIEHYRAQHNEELDEHADKLLKRLANSVEAAEAFERLKPKDDSEAAIIRACIEAENLARTFPGRVKKLEEMLERRERLGKAAAMLRGLLDEISWEQRHPDPLWVRGPETAEDIKAMGLGLALFDRRIFFEKDVVERNVSWLRVTRKSKTLRAGPTAAIGRLSEKVRRVTGKAHYGEIADLAGVIFKVDVSLDQVRATQRPPFEWLRLSLPETLRKPPKVARSRAK